MNADETNQEFFWIGEMGCPTDDQCGEPTLCFPGSEPLMIHRLAEHAGKGPVTIAGVGQVIVVSDDAVDSLGGREMRRIRIEPCGGTAILRAEPDAQQRNSGGIRVAAVIVTYPAVEPRPGESSRELFSVQCIPLAA